MMRLRILAGRSEEKEIFVLKEYEKKQQKVKGRIWK